VDVNSGQAEAMGNRAEDFLPLLSLANIPRRRVDGEDQFGALLRQLFKRVARIAAAVT